MDMRGQNENEYVIPHPLVSVWDWIRFITNDDFLG